MRRASYPILSLFKKRGVNKLALLLVLLFFGAPILFFYNPKSALAQCLVEFDLDLDFVCNADDNCPAVYNPGQEDGDNDGVGDVCDSCPSESGIVDGIDRDANDDGCLDTAEELLVEIQAADLPRGIEQPLSAIVQAAINSYDSGNDNAGNNQLNVLIIVVAAQHGKNIPAELADLFIAKSENIIALH